MTNIPIIDIYKPCLRPDNMKAKLTINLTENDKATIDAEAERNRLTTSGFCRNLILKHLNFPEVASD